MVVDLAGWEVNHTPVGRLVDFGNIICIEFRVKNLFSQRSLKCLDDLYARFWDDNNKTVFDS